MAEWNNAPSSRPPRYPPPAFVTVETDCKLQIATCIATDHIDYKQMRVCQSLSNRGKQFALATKI